MMPELVPDPFKKQNIYQKSFIKLTASIYL